MRPLSRFRWFWLSLRRVPIPPLSVGITNEQHTICDPTAQSLAYRVSASGVERFDLIVLVLVLSEAVLVFGYG